MRPRWLTEPDDSLENIDASRLQREAFLRSQWRPVKTPFSERVQGTADQLVSFNRAAHSTPS